MNRPSNIPRATYRLQLNRDFTFNQASRVVPYLSSLGISHCYISPFLKARSGSMHGYDIVDHNSLNPEIGTPEEFDRFVEKLHQHGMGLILDVVPNHMGVMGADNVWWLDVLENGESSIYANFFDIDWYPLKDELHGKVLVPVLHDHYGAVLESGELKLVFHPERGEFDISYRGHRFPVNPREYPRILEPAAALLTAQLPGNDPNLLEFQSLITAFSHLPARQGATNGSIVERNRDKDILKRRLAGFHTSSPEIMAAIKQALDSINGIPGDPASFDKLHELIKGQAFRLANWRVAFDDINYRRFFDSNDLAGIRMEDETLFEATHGLILKMVADGKVNGLRIDHPDGLYDPAQYFERLQSALIKASGNPGPTSAEPTYIVIEKILTGSERLPDSWPVSGTTGYDFANLVNGLFVDPAGGARFERIYRNFTADDTEIDDLAYRCRKLIVRVALASEVNVLANQLTRIALAKRRTCDFTLNGLRDALTEVVASFPVYRTYVSPLGVSKTDANYIGIAISAAKLRSPAAETSIFNFVEDVLLTRIADGQDAAYRDAVTTFAMKFQQFTSPVMAKGLEDTAFYRYNRLISLNEVGGDLQRFGITTKAFHRANQDRVRDCPHTMLATSTHDSKRSEDVRARINVLSEIPAQWRLRVRDWRLLNRPLKTLVNGRRAPSANDEYLLYQTLVGVWPSTPLNSEAEWESFFYRIERYMLKAIREAKENTSWINPNHAYEATVSSFVRALLTPGAKNKFLRDFPPFQQRISRLGVWNSLSQTLLKLTCPGVPDIYQGNELFDFSLVDPDNRRPIDYSRRQEMFASVHQMGDPDSSSLRSLLETPEDGRLKLHVIWKTLCMRKQRPDLFRMGQYIPLEVQGAKADHIAAFVREFDGHAILVAAPRLMASLLTEAHPSPLGRQIWEDTHIFLPISVLPKSSASTSCCNVFSGECRDLKPSTERAGIDVADLLAEFPVGLCTVK